MYRRLFFSIGVSALFGVPLLGTFTAPAEANHSWNGYHWARTSNPFNLKVGDNVSGAWDPVLFTTISDWSASDKVDMVKVSGSGDPRKCRATSGRDQVCNATYGRNGWLGIATVWISGSHITQGTVKLNDSYHNSAPYNTTEWRNLVSCQEVGHTLGLDHQDETFSNTNLGTCMDYTNDPTGTAGTNGTKNNEHPNTHDYEELDTIYQHTDNTTTVLAIAPSARGFQGQDDEEPGDSPKEWGQAKRSDPSGQPNVFEKNLNDGRKKVTHVFWAPDKKVKSHD
jgi:hypothetical protein